MKYDKKLAFNLHKRGAGYRGIEFHFTLEGWTAWWENNLGPDWPEKRGKGIGKYVMARDGDRGPYAVWNVKCITHTANSREQTKKSKLTEDQVKAIYQSKDTSQVKLAKQFNISPRTIRDIKTKKTWGSVTDLLDLVS